MRAGRCFLQAVAVLVLFNVARSAGLLGPPRYAWVSVVLLTAALALIAWSAGATAADLGLDRTALPAGVRYGAGAVSLVLLILIIAAVIPATNGFLHDARAQISGGRMLYELAVSILLLTAIPEEFAFRGVLLGSALRLWGPWRASLITSALFGLWHIAPTLHTMSDNRAVAGAAGSVAGQVLVVSGSVAVTFAAGLLFCWLRLRSRSLIAPVMAHFATNGLALAVAWFTVHHPRLAEAKAVVKSLSDVETLGGTTVINSDKTGTLTMNAMTATQMLGATADPLASRYARHLARQAGQHAGAELPGIPERRLIRRAASRG